VQHASAELYATGSENLKGDSLGNIVSVSRRIILRRKLKSTQKLGLHSSGSRHEKVVGPAEDSSVKCENLLTI
jgi:hypothetical protein